MGWRKEGIAGVDDYFFGQKGDKKIICGRYLI